MKGHYLRNSGILALTELALRLRGIILIPLLTKYLGALNFGVWAQVSVITSMLSPILALGLDSAVVRFLPGQTKDDIARGFSAVIVYLSLVSTFVAVLLWVAARPLASAFFNGESNWPFVAICGAVIFVGLLLNQCRNYFRVVANARGYAAIALAQGASGLLVGVVAVTTKRSVWIIVLMTLLADALLLAIVLSVIARRHGVSKPDWKILLPYLRFGLPLVPAGYAMWALNSSDRLFIGHYGSLGDIGIYTVVYALGYTLISLIFNPIALMYPSYAAIAFNRGDFLGLESLFAGVIKAALGLLIPATVGLAVLSRPVLTLLTTEEFIRGARLVPLITVAYALHMLSSLFDVNLGLVGKQAWSTVNITIAMAVNIGLNFFFVPTWGITGAAVTTLIGFSIQFALSAAMGYRFIKLPIDVSFLVKSVIATAVMGLVMTALPLAHLRFMLLPVVALAMIVYSLAMLGLRAVTRDELRALWQAARRSRQIDDSTREAGIEPVLASSLP
jgi:O-antigen/teichoic acid export membrane protein